MPPEFTPETVKTHLKTIAQAAERDPDLWKSSLESISPRLGLEMEALYSNAQASAQRAAKLPREERIKAQEEIRTVLESGRGEMEMAHVSMKVIRAAIRAGESRLVLARLEAEIAEGESAAAAITSEIVKLQSPDEKCEKRIKALKEERSRMENFRGEFSTSTNQEFRDGLSSSCERGELKCEPTEKGFNNRLDEIQFELESLTENLYANRLPDDELMPRLYELRDRRNPLEERLKIIRAEVASKQADAQAAADILESTLAACLVEARAVIFAYEVEHEVRLLAAGE